MDSPITGLNEEQKVVVEATEGEIALVAGPGAGKTKTLIARYNHLLDQGVRKDEILALTFTKEATNEMTRRGGRGNFSTFHAYGLSILNAEHGQQQFEPELRHRLLCKIIRQRGLDYKELVRFISKARHEGWTEEEALEANYLLARGFQDYERERQAAGWIDFDCMIVDAVHLLENPSVRARHQWRYIMADECQDTDDVQFRMIQLLSERHKNVLCVGDPGQSIYMFRGAKPENLTEFQKWFPNGRFMYLGRNYRSTHSIVEYVRENYPIETPLKEKLLPARTESGTPIGYKMFYSDADEAEDAIAKASQDGLNSAILARTNRSLAVIENFCIERNVPYTLLGKSGFWKQSEITRTVEKLKPFSHLPIETVLRMVMPDLERHYQAEDATPEDNYALENIRTLKQIAEKRGGSAKDFVGFATRAAHAKRKTRGITLSTVHQAKGTEYKNVFVIQAQQDIMPHCKGDYQEERRIWFVAISRAIDNLRISFAGPPSAFVGKYLNTETLKRLQEERGQVERFQKQSSLF